MLLPPHLCITFLMKTVAILRHYQVLLIPLLRVNESFLSSLLVISLSIVIIL